MLDSALEPSYIVKKSFITAMDTEIISRYGKWFNPPDIVNFLTMILYLILWVEVQIQTSEESCCSALDDSYNGKKINQENVFIFSSAKRIVV